MRPTLISVGNSLRRRKRNRSAFASMRPALISAGNRSELPSSVSIQIGFNGVEAGTDRVPEMQDQEQMCNGLQGFIRLPPVGAGKRHIWTMTRK